MAVNGIRVKFTCAKCGKVSEMSDNGIFTYKGELFGDLKVDIPLGWISLDIHDNTADCGSYDSQDFCSYGCLIDYFRGKDISGMLGSVGKKDK